MLLHRVLCTAVDRNCHTANVYMTDRNASASCLTRYCWRCSAICACRTSVGWLKCARRGGCLRTTVGCGHASRCVQTSTDCTSSTSTLWWRSSVQGSAERCATSNCRPTSSHRPSYTSSQTGSAVSAQCVFLFAHNIKIHTDSYIDNYILTIAFFLCFMFFVICVSFFIGCVLHQSNKRIFM